MRRIVLVFIPMVSSLADCDLAFNAFGMAPYLMMQRSPHHSYSFKIPLVQSATGTSKYANQHFGSCHSATSHRKTFTLRNLRASYSPESNPNLVYAIKAKDYSTAISLLEAGANPNDVDDWGVTCLQLAVKSGQQSIVDALLQKGANVNRSDVDDSSTSPLHSAVQGGFLDLVEILVKNGADVNRKDDFGCTPYKIATDAKRTDIARFLEPLLQAAEDAMTPVDIAGLDMMGKSLTKAEADALLEDNADWEAAERGEDSSAASVVQVVTDPTTGQQTVRRVPLKSDFMKNLEAYRRRNS